MIKEICHEKDYSEQDLNCFINNYPERYKLFQSILNDYESSNIQYKLSIDFPKRYNTDFGVIISYTVVKDNKININNVRYF